MAGGAPAPLVPAADQARPVPAARGGPLPRAAQAAAGRVLKLVCVMDSKSISYCMPFIENLAKSAKMDCKISCSTTMPASIEFSIKLFVCSTTTRSIFFKLTVNQHINPAVLVRMAGFL